MLYCTALQCAVLYRVVLYCIVLCCAVLRFNVLYYIVLCCAVLRFNVLYCIVLCCAVLYCTVLQCDVIFDTTLVCNIPWNYQYFLSSILPFHFYFCFFFFYSLYVPIFLHFLPSRLFLRILMKRAMIFLPHWLFISMTRQHPLLSANLSFPNLNPNKKKYHPFFLV